MKAAEARPGAQQMDGKHTGTGSTPAAKEAQRGKKKKKKVNFFFFLETKDKLKVEERIKCVEMKEIIAGSGQCGEQKRYEKNEKLKIRT